MKKKSVFGIMLIILLMGTLYTMLNLKPVAGWSNGGYSSDPNNPNYGTHDWIAQHALDWLPNAEKEYIVNNLAIYLYGTELPDNSGAPDGIGDTALHHIYYWSNESLQDDASATRAQTEYNKALNYVTSGDVTMGVKTLGIMSHYIVDVGVFGHVMGSGTDWGPEVHHSDYETYVEGRTNSYDDEFNTYLAFDGSFDTISAYDAACALAYDTTFDIDGDLTCVWMDQNYDWSNNTFRDRCGESLNLAVNSLADVLYTFYMQVPWVWVRDTVTGAYGEAVVGTSTALYVARGTSFYRYRPSDSSFVELADPPKPDGYAFETGTALTWDFGDYIYALYGAATGDSRRWFYRYCISSDSWETLTNTTADQGEGNAITWVGIDNCIYATIGGEERPTYFLRYNPSTNSWSDAPTDPPAGMGDGASLVWTGDNYLHALRGEFLESSPLYDFWRYSLIDNAWTVMADIPALPHSGGVGGVGDGGSLLYAGFWLPSYTDYIYALSGNQAHPDGIPDNRTYRYTISTNSWERLADLPFGVGYYVGCRLGYAEGHIYAWQGAPSTWTGGGDDLARYRLAWIVDDDGPSDFHTIQEAINAANEGDTVYVRAGIYFESIAVNKSISLIGEDPTTTLIDGSLSPVVVVDVYKRKSQELPPHIGAELTVKISGFTIRNGATGIVLHTCNNSTIYNNVITGNQYDGIFMVTYDLSVNNTIISNNVTNNRWGIVLGSSSKNTIIGNHIRNNAGGISLCSSSNNNIVINNTITNNNAALSIGESENNTITSNRVSSNGVDGMILYEAHNNAIMENVILSSDRSGIRLEFSNNNSICRNYITSNKYGVWLCESYNNEFYHNSFIDNFYQVYDHVWDYPYFSPSINVWDDGYPSGGNYWSDYADVDEKSGPNQDESGSDGIGDTPYEIDANNTDRYPLVAPINIFDAGVWNGVPYNLGVVSNSTVSDFQLDADQKMISFNVTGEEGSAGFCRVAIPNLIVEELWQGNYTVLLNGEPWSFTNWTDPTNTYIYINYTHSQHEIVIIPEFPSAIIMPLFMTLSMLAVVFAKRKLPRKQKI